MSSRRPDRVAAAFGPEANVARRYQSGLRLSSAIGQKLTRAVLTFGAPN